MGEIQKSTYGSVRPYTRHTPGCPYATGAACSLPALRTESVNRGFCISLLMLEIVVLVVFTGCFMFFAIPEY